MNAVVPKPPWIWAVNLFRIGIGLSSSHTVGPMVATARFVADLPGGKEVTSLVVELFGSLALTGKGHATDTAVVLGLLSKRPDRVDPDAVRGLVDAVARSRRLSLPGGRLFPFDPLSDIVFRKRDMLPRHPNALRCTATGPRAVFSKTYYSGACVATVSPTMRAVARADAAGAVVRSAAWPSSSGATALPNPLIHRASLAGAVE